MAFKPYPCGGTYLYGLYKGVPPGRESVASLCKRPTYSSLWTGLWSSGELSPPFPRNFFPKQRACSQATVIVSFIRSEGAALRDDLSRPEDVHELPGVTRAVVWVRITSLPNKMAGKKNIEDLSD